LRPTRLHNYLEVGPARLLAAMLGGLGVFTLSSIKTNVSLRLHRRRLRQVARPLSSSGVDFGEPSWWLCCRQIEVGGPLSVFVFVVFRSANLPAAPLSPSLGC
jgi:hypothetical protein